jgi:hypothetical protein
LIQRLYVNLVLGQFYILDKESKNHAFARTVDLPQGRNLCVDVKVHMEEKLEARTVLVAVATERLARMGIIFEIVIPKEGLEEILPKGHGRIILL